MTSPNQSEPTGHLSKCYRFRLYVAGDGINSVQAMANLTSLCRTHLQESSSIDIEIVDVFLEPMRALEDGVFMTPTLLKLTPAPTRKIVGTLSQIPSLLAALNLSGVAS